jgi:hypothetical protein
MSECPTDDASEAMRYAHHAAEQVEMLLDRYWGDAGSDPAMIHAWCDTLEALAKEIRRELGEPSERMPCGGLTKRSYLDMYRKG